ncbi:hypothetical protein D3C73_969880 [compost metagenome]
MNWASHGHDASLPDVLGGQDLTIKMAITLGVCLLALSGCGTALTVVQSEEEAARDLRKHKTYCQSIPRIYSGLAYDFCVLNAPPEPGGYLASFVLLDLALSGVGDTVVLPYTIYRQVIDGSIGIYWRTTPR